MTWNTKRQQHSATPATKKKKKRRHLGRARIIDIAALLSIGSSNAIATIACLIAWSTFLKSYLTPSLSISISDFNWLVVLCRYVAIDDSARTT